MSPQQPERVLTAFDFDGTITTQDSLRDFVRYAVGNTVALKGLLMSLPALIGWATGKGSRAQAKEQFIRHTLGGMSVEQLHTRAEAYVHNRLPALLRPEMLEQVRKHQEVGHEVIIVSASPTVYLEKWAATMGIETVLATQLACINGLYTGALASPNCWGPEKVVRLKKWKSPSALHLSYAYGDSRGDADMLAIATTGWLRGRDTALPVIRNEL